MLGALLDAAVHGLRALPRCSPHALATDGRLCAVGDGLRNSLMVRRHVCARL
jgi:hypothetical protein